MFSRADWGERARSSIRKHTLQKDFELCFEAIPLIKINCLNRESRQLTDIREAVEVREKINETPVKSVADF